MSIMSKKKGETVSLIRISFTPESAHSENISLSGPFEYKICDKTLVPSDGKNSRRIPLEAVANEKLVDTVTRSVQSIYVEEHRIDAGIEKAKEAIDASITKEIERREEEIEMFIARQKMFESGKFKLRNKIGVE